MPTLETGDFIVVNSSLMASAQKIDVDMPENGDVMVFIPPHKGDYFIKRSLSSWRHRGIQRQTIVC